MRKQDEMPVAETGGLVWCMVGCSVQRWDDRGESSFYPARMREVDLSCWFFPSCTRWIGWTQLDGQQWSLIKDHCWRLKRGHWFDYPIAARVTSRYNGIVALRADCRVCDWVGRYARQLGNEWSNSVTILFVVWQSLINEAWKLSTFVKHYY